MIFFDVYKISLVYIAVFLSISFLISVTFFGYEDTFEYILQRRQRFGQHNQGGSWNLHLPSTFAMFFLIPVSIILMLKFLKKERQIAKIIKINETIKNDEPCIILIEKLNVDKLLNFFT